MKRISRIGFAGVFVLLASSAMLFSGCGGGGDDGVPPNLNSLFSGDYQVHGMDYEWGDVGAGFFDVIADGNGNGTVPGHGDITYNVALDKTITLNVGAGYEPGYGILSIDGSIGAFTDVVYDIPNSTDKDIDISVAVKKSSGMTMDMVAGEYIVSQAGSNSSGFYTSRVLVTLNNDTTGTWEILSHSQGTTGQGPLSYSLSTDGTFTVNNGVADDFGIISPAGSMFVLSDGDTGDGDGEVIFAVGVRKSTGTIPPDMTGEMFINQIALWEPLTMPEVYTSRVGLTFGSDTFSYEVLEHSLGYTGSGADIPYAVLPDGTVSIQGMTADVIVSSDGNLFVAVDTDPTTENEIVLAIGIKR